MSERAEDLADDLLAIQAIRLRISVLGHVGLHLADTPLASAEQYLSK